ncbi:MAG: transcriptional repressor [Clostridiales bacterium]|nr:transcriptional repressor [Candidatus Equinaster intestinalis]
MLTRFSKKRQAIMEYLSASSEHPSAEQIYNSLKTEYPDISLGTVYRNLNKLLKDGKIVSVGTVLGKERFDAKTLPHTHAVCKKCGSVIDLFEVKLPEETLLNAAKASDFEIEYSNLQFVGICKNCRDKNA